MKDQSIITLTTDFGTRDGYVGAMKGLILSINPAARIVDITHDIEPQDVLGAALALSAACRAFPRGTVHVGVVDPGVGSERKPLLFTTASFFCIGPDNGIFSVSVGQAELEHVIELKASQYFLTPLSDTFHGRDIFAPVAAYLSLGIDPREFGPFLDTYVKIAVPRPAVSRKKIVGQIIHVDRFGNAMTNIDRGLFLKTIGRRSATISVGAHSFEAICRCYADVDEGMPLAIFGSSGHLEISVNRGSASRLLQLGRGDPVQVSWD